jgi:hypothetical protein
VISVVDPDARHAHKTVSRRIHGFKGHVEGEPDTGLVCECALTRASGPDTGDATVGITLLADDVTLAPPTDRQHDDAQTGNDAQTSDVAVFADSAFGTGEALAALAAAGRTAVIKPWPLKPTVPGGFTLDDFAVDEAAGTVTCPNGLIRPISRTRAVTFGAACRGCPLRQRCTTAARGGTCNCTNTTRCSGRTEPAGAPTRSYGRPTAGIGRWSNAPWPG